MNCEPFDCLAHNWHSAFLVCLAVSCVQWLLALIKRFCPLLMSESNLKQTKHEPEVHCNEKHTFIGTTAQQSCHSCEKVQCVWSSWPMFPFTPAKEILKELMSLLAGPSNWSACGLSQVASPTTTWQCHSALTTLWAWLEQGTAKDSHCVGACYQKCGSFWHHVLQLEGSVTSTRNKKRRVDIAKAIYRVWHDEPGLEILRLPFCTRPRETMFVMYKNSKKWALVYGSVHYARNDIFFGLHQQNISSKPFANRHLSN